MEYLGVRIKICGSWRVVYDCRMQKLQDCYFCFFLSSIFSIFYSNKNRDTISLEGAYQWWLHEYNMSIFRLNWLIVEYIHKLCCMYIILICKKVGSLHGYTEL
jgi:hypothetical protein